MPSDPRMDVRSGAVFGLSIGICSSRVVGFVGPVAATAGGYDRRITRSRRDRCDHTDDNPRFKWDYFNHGRSGRSGRLPIETKQNVLWLLIELLEEAAVAKTSPTQGRSDD